MSVVYYEGERIYFRPIELEDGPVFQKWINDPGTWSTLGFRAPINALQERQFIESRKSDGSEYIFGIVVREGDRLIGSCGLHGVSTVDRKAVFGIMIGEAEQRNRGYGTETARLILRFAFEELNLNRVRLEVLEGNARAIRAYEKAGFEREGCFRQAVWRHGRYHDLHQYAMLREKWLSLRDAEPAATAKVAS